MKWNWQQPNWPNFRYDTRALKALEDQFLQQTGVLIGTLTHINEEDKNTFTVDLLGDEAFKTSEIEGEFLNRDSLRSSIRRNLGLSSDGKKIPQAEQGIADMMIDLLRNFNRPVSNTTLFAWHKMLMFDRRHVFVIGNYRTHQEAMQVVSGHYGKLKVHFEAPPSENVKQEMKRFIQWFKDSLPSGKNPLPALTRSAIAHLYFVCIHPFEDGNGRIGRAIAQKSLFQSLNQPAFIALSHVIEKHKKEYYSALQDNNTRLEITDWIIYFAKTILEAQQYTQRLVLFLVEKARLYNRVKDQLNPRQEKVLARMFEEGLEGFEGGLSAKNYMKIAQTAPSTATRDLTELLNMGVFFRTGELKHTRYFINIKTSQ